MSLLNKLPSGLCVNDTSTASINRGMYRKVHNTHSSVPKLKAKLDGFYSPYKDNCRLRAIEENERCVDR